MNREQFESWLYGQAISGGATTEQLQAAVAVHTNQTNLEIARLQAQPKISNRTENSESTIELPEVVYNRGICLRNKPCSLNRNLKKIRPSLATELKSKSIGASMLTWSIVKTLPNDDSLFKDGTWPLALGESTSWRNAPLNQQKAAYEELCGKEEFSEVMAPLHEHFKASEKYELHNSPLVQALAAECELDAKAIAASPKGGPTEAAIRLMGVAYREQAENKTLVVSDLVKLRPQWLAKVNAIEDRTKMAQAVWKEERQKCTT